jgi:hypothetical protein
MNEIILGFSAKVCLKGETSAYSACASTMLANILVEAESKVSPFIIKAELCRNCILLNKTTTNCGNLTAC